MREKPKIKTFLGELEVEYVYKDSTGYYAVTGRGLSRRTWMLSLSEYEKLKRRMK